MSWQDYGAFDAVALDLRDGFPQGSQEWHQARLGSVTASRIADVMARTRSGYGAARHTYMRQLIAERLTGMPAEAYVSPAMRWGVEMEPHAVAAYEEVTDVETAAVGFLRHPNLLFAGASPDRLVGSDGLLEVKCPTTVTHVDTLLGEKSLSGIPCRCSGNWRVATGSGATSSALIPGCRPPTPVS